MAEEHLLRDSLTSLVTPFAPCSRSSHAIRLSSGPGVIAGELHQSVDALLPEVYSVEAYEAVEEDYIQDDAEFEEVDLTETVDETPVSTPTNNALKQLLNKGGGSAGTKRVAGEGRGKFDPSQYLDPGWNTVDSSTLPADERNQAMSVLNDYENADSSDENPAASGRENTQEPAAEVEKAVDSRALMKEFSILRDI